MISLSSPSVQVIRVTGTPWAAYLAMVAPVPIDSSSGWACTSSSPPPEGPGTAPGLARGQAGLAAFQHDLQRLDGRPRLLVQARAVQALVADDDQQRRRAHRIDGDDAATAAGGGLPQRSLTGL